MACRCHKAVSLYRAAQMVRGGSAEWVTEGNRTLHNDVYVVGGVSRRTPRGATIDSKHIYRAYVIGRKKEQKRIEEYGLLTLEARLPLIREVSQELFDEMEKNDAGVMVIRTLVQEQRTPGGISKENR
jgi:hypothetical protein